MKPSNFSTPLKIATDCSGIGAPEQAIKNLGIPHRVVFACEKDKYARKTYEANHTAETFYEDMTTRDNAGLEQVDWYVAGIPCQSFSIAGKRLGESDARGTLFYNSWDYIKQNRPRFFTIENVKGLLSADKGKIFNNWLTMLATTVNGQYYINDHPDCLGYHVHWCVLNSKDFGVPQNRERVFIVGLRDEADQFRFPLGFPLKLRLKDILEPTVPEKYYLSQKMVECLSKERENYEGKFEPKNDDDETANCLKQNYHKMCPTDTYIQASLVPYGNSQDQKLSPLDGISQTLNSGHFNQPKIIEPELKQVGSLYKDNNDAGRIYSSDGISSTIKSEGGGLGAKTGLYEVQIAASRGRGAKQKTKQKLELRKDELTNTITGVQKDNLVYNSRIRRLTPLECFRLQGYPDSFIKVVSDTQLYKQAGNTITVSVLQAIAKNLFL